MIHLVFVGETPAPRQREHLHHVLDKHGAIALVPGNALEVPTKEGHPPQVWYINRVLFGVGITVILESGVRLRPLSSAEINSNVAQMVQELASKNLNVVQQTAYLTKFIAGLMTGRIYSGD